ncbi:MAG: N-6 DNA methylase, partial [Lentisphaeria bacterium]|nr:N-6 DNA methylase [Lentisphaeria bacterium]
MTMLQMDLFSFAMMQATVRKPAEEPKAPILKNFRLNENFSMPTATAARIAANLEAVRLLKHADLKNLTDEQKITLAGFTGWGGLTEVFMEENPEYEELKDLLTADEYETAAASMLDSYYTPENLIRFMWDIAQNELGIKSGKVAELGCGTGNFIGCAPSGNYRFFGVEIDRISGRIARTLYPEADIRIDSLEKVNLPTDIDLMIGNVPFGQTAPYDPKFKQYNSWNLHNYFIAKGLNTLKPDGHAVLLTSSSTMDHPGAMVGFLNDAGLVKAYRLPKKTFAGTEIVADILIFKKGYHDELSGNLEWVETGDGTGRMEINRYFAQHPENVWGILSNTGKMYGQLNTPTVLPDDKTLDEHIAEAEATRQPKKAEEPVGPNVNLFGEVQVQTEPESAAEAEDEPVRIPYYCREYSIFTSWGKIYQVINGCAELMKDRKDKP